MGSREGILSEIMAVCVVSPILIRKRCSLKLTYGGISVRIIYLGHT